MREAGASEQQQGGRGQYTKDGSLAQELKREEREKAVLSHAARTRETDDR